MFKEELNRRFIVFGFVVLIGFTGLRIIIDRNDIMELKSEVKELRSENEAFKICFKKLCFVIGFEESESREEK